MYLWKMPSDSGEDVSIPNINAGIVILKNTYREDFL